MKSQNVEVSIITPAYKCKSTIRETYESIKQQTFSNWEWIIIEDNSPDDSFEFIQNMVKGDSRVVVLRTEKNSGAAVARNVGINYAKGRFIAFLDSDDLWLKDKLKLQLKFMKDSNYALTYTNYYVMDNKGKYKELRLKKDKATYKSLLRRNVMGCLTVMYDTQQTGKILMPLDCEKREDYGAWLDATRNGTVAYRLDVFLAVYRVGSISVSSNKFKMVKYQYRVFRNHEKFGVFKSVWFLLVMSFNKIFNIY
jgi:teichuronic acid biosynthesis glycosyltransferase TuaG